MVERIDITDRDRVNAPSAINLALQRAKRDEMTRYVVPTANGLRVIGYVPVTNRYYQATPDGQLYLCERTRR